MTAHQNDVARLEALGQRSSKPIVSDEQVGACARNIADLENGCALADEAGHVEDGAEGHGLEHAQRHDRVRVAMNDGLDLRVRAVDLTVNEALEVDLPPRRIHRLAIKRECDDVLSGHM